MQQQQKRSVSPMQIKTESEIFSAGQFFNTNIGRKLSPGPKSPFQKNQERFQGVITQPQSQQSLPLQSQNLISTTQIPALSQQILPTYASPQSTIINNRNFEKSPQFQQTQNGVQKPNNVIFHNNLQNIEKTQKPSENLEIQLSKAEKFNTTQIKSLTPKAQTNYFSQNPIQQQQQPIPIQPQQQPQQQQQQQKLPTFRMKSPQPSQATQQTQNSGYRLHIPQPSNNSSIYQGPISYGQSTSRMGENTSRSPQKGISLSIHEDQQQQVSTKQKPIAQQQQQNEQLKITKPIDLTKVHQMNLNNAQQVPSSISARTQSLQTQFSFINNQAYQPNLQSSQFSQNLQASTQSLRNSQVLIHQIQPQQPQNIVIKTPVSSQAKVRSLTPNYVPTYKTTTTTINNNNNIQSINSTQQLQNSIKINVPQQSYNLTPKQPVIKSISPSPQPTTIHHTRSYTIQPTIQQQQTILPQQIQMASSRTLTQQNTNIQMMNSSSQRVQNTNTVQMMNSSSQRVIPSQASPRIVKQIIRQSSPQITLNNSQISVGQQDQQPSYRSRSQSPNNQNQPQVITIRNYSIGSVNQQNVLQPISSSEKTVIRRIISPDSTTNAQKSPIEFFSTQNSPIRTITIEQKQKKAKTPENPEQQQQIKPFDFTQQPIKNNSSINYANKEQEGDTQKGQEGRVGESNPRSSIQYQNQQEKKIPPIIPETQSNSKDSQYFQKQLQQQQDEEQQGEDQEAVKRAGIKQTNEEAVHQSPYMQLSSTSQNVDEQKKEEVQKYQEFVNQNQYSQNYKITQSHQGYTSMAVEDKKDNEQQQQQFYFQSAGKKISNVQQQQQFKDSPKIINIYKQESQQSSFDQKPTQKDNQQQFTFGKKQNSSFNTFQYDNSNSTAKYMNLSNNSNSNLNQYNSATVVENNSNMQPKKLESTYKQINIKSSKQEQFQEFEKQINQFTQNNPKLSAEIPLSSEKQPQQQVEQQQEENNEDNSFEDLNVSEGNHKMPLGSYQKDLMEQHSNQIVQKIEKLTQDNKNELKKSQDSSKQLKKQRDYELFDQVLNQQSQPPLPNNLDKPLQIQQQKETEESNKQQFDIETYKSIRERQRSKGTLNTSGDKLPSSNSQSPRKNQERKLSSQQQVQPQMKEIQEEKNKNPSENPIQLQKNRIQQHTILQNHQSPVRSFEDELYIPSSSKFNPNSTDINTSREHQGRSRSKSMEKFQQKITEKLSEAILQYINKSPQQNLPLNLQQPQIGLSEQKKLQSTSSKISKGEEDPDKLEEVVLNIFENALNKVEKVNSVQRSNNTLSNIPLTNQNNQNNSQFTNFSEINPVNNNPVSQQALTSKQNNTFDHLFEKALDSVSRQKDLSIKFMEQEKEIKDNVLNESNNNNTSSNNKFSSPEKTTSQKHQSRQNYIQFSGESARQFNPLLSNNPKNSVKKEVNFMKKKSHEFSPEVAKDSYNVSKQKEEFMEQLQSKQDPRNRSNSKSKQFDNIRPPFNQYAGLNPKTNRSEDETNYSLLHEYIRKSRSPSRDRENSKSKSPQPQMRNISSLSKSPNTSSSTRNKKSVTPSKKFETGQQTGFQSVRNPNNANPNNRNYIRENIQKTRKNPNKIQQNILNVKGKTTLNSPVKKPAVPHTARSRNASLVDQDVLAQQDQKIKKLVQNLSIKDAPDIFKKLNQDAKRRIQETEQVDQIVSGLKSKHTKSHTTFIGSKPGLHRQQQEPHQDISSNMNSARKSSAGKEQNIVQRSPQQRSIVNRNYKKPSVTPPKSRLNKPSVSPMRPSNNPVNKKSAYQLNNQKKQAQPTKPIQQNQPKKPTGMASNKSNSNATTSNNQKKIGGVIMAQQKLFDHLNSINKFNNQ